jgi:hypothetical protein
LHVGLHAKEVIQNKEYSLAGTGIKFAPQHCSYVGIHGLSRAGCAVRPGPYVYIPLNVDAVLANS